MKQYSAYAIIVTVSILILISLLSNRTLFDSMGKTKPAVFRHGSNKSIEKLPTQVEYCESRMTEYWRPGFDDENNTAWPFDLQKLWDCPQYYYNQPSTNRQKVVLDCSTSPKLLKVAARSSNDIQIVQPGNKCLRAYIQNCCNDKNKKVPNVLHYVWYSNITVGFYNMVSFIGAIRFMKPCLILFHGPYIPRGEFWDVLLGVYPNVIIVNETLITEIFGQKLKFKEHGSDIMRIRAIQEYGGVYLDWDQMLLKPIEPLRTFRFTMSQEFKEKIGNQFIMGEPNATFLTHYLNGYRNYSHKWAYNSISYPYKLSKKFPDLINVLPHSALIPKNIGKKQIFEGNFDWSENYALHFYLRIFKRRDRMNMISIRHENSTLAAISRRIMLGKKEMCKFMEL